MMSIYDFLIVEAQGLNLIGISGALEGVFNNIIGIFLIIAFGVFIWNIIRFIRNPSEKDFGFRSRVLWGVVAIFILVSVYGFIALFRILISP